MLSDVREKTTDGERLAASLPVYQTYCLVASSQESEGYDWLATAGSKSEVGFDDPIFGMSKGVIGNYGWLTMMIHLILDGSKGVRQGVNLVFFW